MTILVTGSTGNVGTLLVKRLAEVGMKVSALSRNPSKAKWPDGVTPIKGDMTDVGSMRDALDGARTLFLLNGVVPDEATQALTTLDFAREAGIQRIVYFSVFNSGLMPEVPHIAAKYVMERIIERDSLPVTVIKPAFFMQNDLALRDALNAGVYPQPLGSRGVAMADLGDIVNVVAAELVRRDVCEDPLPRSTIEVVGPDTLTGTEVAAIWASVLGRPIAYLGDDVAAYEERISKFLPPWVARDLRLMFAGFQRVGVVPNEATRPMLTSYLGNKLRDYPAFAEEAAAAWSRQ